VASPPPPPAPNCVRAIDVTFTEMSFPPGTTFGDPYCVFVGENGCCVSPAPGSGISDLSAVSPGDGNTCVVGLVIEYTPVTLPPGYSWDNGGSLVCLPACDYPGEGSATKCCPGAVLPSQVCMTVIDDGDGTYADYEGTYVLEFIANPDGSFGYAQGFAIGDRPAFFLSTGCFPFAPGGFLFYGLSNAGWLAGNVWPSTVVSGFPQFPFGFLFREGFSTQYEVYGSGVQQCDPYEETLNFRAVANPTQKIRTSAVALTFGAPPCPSRYPTADGGLVPYGPALQLQVGTSPPIPFPRTAANLWVATTGFRRYELSYIAGWTLKGSSDILPVLLADVCRTHPDFYQEFRDPGGNPTCYVTLPPPPPGAPPPVSPPPPGVPPPPPGTLPERFTQEFTPVPASAGVTFGLSYTVRDPAGCCGIAAGSGGGVGNLCCGGGYVGQTATIVIPTGPYSGTYSGPWSRIGDLISVQFSGTPLQVQCDAGFDGIFFLRMAGGSNPPATSVDCGPPMIITFDGSTYGSTGVITVTT